MKNLITYTLILFTLFCNAQDWSKIDLGITTDLKKVYFVNDNLGFIIGEEGIMYRTEDGGDTWNQIALGTSNLLATITFVDANEGYTNGYKTTDGGQTWTEQPSTASFLMLYAKNENTLFAGTDNFAGDILASVDGSRYYPSISSI